MSAFVYLATKSLPPVYVSTTLPKRNAFSRNKDCLFSLYFYPKRVVYFNHLKSSAHSVPPTVYIRRTRLIWDIVNFSVRVRVKIIHCHNL